MDYCDKCAIERGWPQKEWCDRVNAPCEICGKRSACSSVQSKYLPIPNEEIWEQP